jgi:N-acetylmuramoyl-L-alanine amidase
LQYRQLGIGIFMSIVTSHGLVEQLQAQSTSAPIPISPRIITTPAPEVANEATIEKLIFTSAGQLIIEASKPISYQVGFDIPSSSYKLIVANAKISANLQRPSLAANSPIERIRLSQVGNSVEIGIKTTAGWQIRETQRANSQTVNLQVSLNSVVPVTGNQPNNSNLAMPVSPPANNTVVNNGDRRRGVILVDPGHGGRDPGAIGNGIQEKDVVLPISLFLGQSLQSMGYTVYYSRTNDVEVDLAPRVSLAERVNADVFVSIHANSLASRNSNVNGVETFYARGSSLGRELATLVQSQIIADTRANDRGPKAAGFYVIVRTSMPAILVESGFVTNPTEAANLNNPNYQKLMADAIAKGIDQFMRGRRR